MKALTLSQALELLVKVRERINEIRETLVEIGDQRYRGSRLRDRNNRRLLYDYVTESSMQRELDVLFNCEGLTSEQAQRMKEFKYEVIHEDGEIPMNICDDMLKMIHFRFLHDQEVDRETALLDYIDTFSKDEIKKIRREDKLKLLAELKLV